MKATNIQVSGYEPNGNFTVLFFDGEFYHETNYDPKNYDVTGEEQKHLEQFNKIVSEKEENGEWIKGYVTAHVVVEKW